MADVPIDPVPGDPPARVPLPVDEMNLSIGQFGGNAFLRQADTGEVLDVSDRCDQSERTSQFCSDLTLVNQLAMATSSGGLPS